MGIKINISDSKISGKILNDASLEGGENIDIELSKLDIGEQAMVLNNLQIETIMNKLNENALYMDKNSDEYHEVQKLLTDKKSDCGNLSKKILKHIMEFSQGVLASIVANYIVKN